MKKLGKDKLLLILFYFLLTVISAFCIFPILFAVIGSFTSEAEVASHGFRLFPESLTLDTYKYVFLTQGKKLVNAYKISIINTIAGTAISLFVTITYAYVISVRDFKMGNKFAFFAYFTMLFNGGLVPTYMMWTQSFHIKNTLWALIIPGLLMNGFYIIMMRSFFQANIPDALIEAARIDGGGEYRILFQVVTPLSKPIMATMALMIGLGYWNDWMNSLYYITDDKLFSIQAILNTIITNIQFLTSGQSSAASSVNVANLPSIGIRMAIAVIGILPVLCIYPFFQKYFVKGIVVGGVKG